MENLKIKKLKLKLLYSVKNYLVYYLTDVNLFYLINIKNYKNVGIIINAKTSYKDKSYYYYNLYFNKICYIYNMNDDREHQSNTKDMICKTKEILEINKINYFKSLFS